MTTIRTDIEPIKSILERVETLERQMALLGQPVPTVNTLTTTGNPQRSDAWKWQNGLDPETLAWSSQPADAGGEDAKWEQVNAVWHHVPPEGATGNERHLDAKRAVARAVELGLVPLRVDPEDMDLHASVQSILDQQVWSDLKSADELTTEVLATIAEYQNGSDR